MPDLVPVDTQPEFDHSLVPVDHNPFADSLTMGVDPSTMNPIANVASGLASQFATLPQRAIDAGGQDIQNWNDPNYVPQTIGPAVETAMTMMGGSGAVPAEANSLRMGIKAYHGSPHDFDAFDLSKIGTGEGAQAYGHGLYFADNEGVAQSYRDALADWKINGAAADPNNPSHIAAATLKANGGDTGKAYSDLARTATLGPETERPAAVKAMEMIQNGSPLPKATGGHMYQVDINADPEHFLDWDKPLDPDTLAKVQSAAQNIKPGLYDRMMGQGKDLAKWSLTNPDATAPKTGESVVGALKRGLGSDQAATQALSDAGIPGIKYLDQGSRAAGDGSRNYVVFNDKLVNIIKKYGVAGLPAGYAAAASQQFVPVDHDPEF